MRTKTLMFLITYKCNLRCSYCYEPKGNAHTINSTRLKPLIRDNVLTLPDEYDSFEIHFMGGEPLLEFNLIREVSEWLWTQNFDKSLSMVYAPTNGTLLNDEIKDWCTRNHERFCLGLSFDGDESMQNINRSESSSSIDLDFFVRTWPHQSVKMTISPATIDYLADGVRYLHSKGFKKIVADLARGTEIGWNKNHLKQLSRQLDELSRFYMTHKDEYKISLLDIDIFGLQTDQRKAYKSCSCGEDLTCIDVDGTGYACHLFSPVAIHIDKARRALSIDFTKYESLQNLECQKCALNCLCNHCYGMNYVCTNNVSTPDPFHCAAFKTMYIANCRHRLRMAKHNDNNEEISRIGKLIDIIIEV